MFIIYLEFCPYCNFAMLYTHLFHVCPSWKRDPSSAALLEVSSIFPPVKGFFGGVFPYPNRGSMEGGFCMLYRL